LRATHNKTPDVFSLQKQASIRKGDKLNRSLDFNDRLSSSNYSGTDGSSPFA
jgi:hypothetical protein